MKKSGGRSNRPSPQSPKGILGSSSPFGYFYRTPSAKAKRLKLQGLCSTSPEKIAPYEQKMLLSEGLPIPWSRNAPLVPYRGPGIHG